MNMQAYKADTTWNRWFPFIFFTTQIQLYLLRSFLYSLTSCIKEVIKGKIFWRMNLKVLDNEAATAWNREIPSHFSKHWYNCICFVYFSIFDLLYQRGYQKSSYYKKKMFQLSITVPKSGKKQDNKLHFILKFKAWWDFISVVQFHLVHLCVQCPTWCLSKSTFGLIGNTGLCINFIDRV